MKKQDYNVLMRAARKRVEAMDKADGSTTADHPLDLALRTAMSALNAAMGMGDWSVAADAMVMLQQIELRYRPADLKSGGMFMMEK